MRLPSELKDYLDSNVYKVTPKKIRFFNQELYDDPEVEGLFEVEVKSGS